MSYIVKQHHSDGFICIMQQVKNTCIECKEEKVFDDFVKNKTSPNGIRNLCKNCNNKRYFEKNKNKVRSKSRATEYDDGTKYCTTCKVIKPKTDFYLKYKDRDRLSSKCMECMSMYQKCKQYDITKEQYLTLVTEQKGLCKICKSFMSKKGKNRALYVDHDHATGAIRGLLCSNCNVGIGLLKDDPKVLYAAYVYLSNNKRT